MIIKGILSLVFIIGFVAFATSKIGYFWALVSVFLLFFMMRSFKKR